MGDYEPVRTLDGRTVLISKSEDVYSETVVKLRSLNVRLAREVTIAHCGDRWEKETDDLISDYDNRLRDISVESLIRSLRINHVKHQLLVGKKRKPLTAADIDNFVSDIGAGGIYSIECPENLSPAFCRSIAKSYKETTIDSLCDVYGISPVLKTMEVKNVVRVIMKAFVVEGAGFVLARIISQDGITVAREGVSESPSPEYAELELLRRVSEVASRSGNRVEIVTRTANVVNWLEGINQRIKTHEDLRAEILEWLTPLSYHARMMTDEEHQAYRAEKKGK